ncbi:gp083L [Rabbit fibroma virus]|uniref:Cell surface-binding protein OPG105 n=1 Tax=Rabbit fibroma virus (strain Kasza) TaxID=10272 RepID=Q9Q8Z4_RFVKA|nr:gp083L [Rabbit fibroma virus]AAF17967.1 gp083L [Rabbit fibroma virus]
MSSRQESPIDLKIYNTTVEKYPPLDINYGDNSTRIHNNGSTLKVLFNVSVPSTLQGGPLKSKYVLSELSFRWGRSEHSVNGAYYIGEVQMVHWNLKYTNYDNARKYKDGVVILAVFLKTGRLNDKIELITSQVSNIVQKNASHVFTGFNPISLLPKCLDYWTYAGTTTASPIDKNVTWIVFKEPIPISAGQLGRLRTMISSDPGKPVTYIYNNFRETQPVKEYNVKASFSNAEGCYDRHVYKNPFVELYALVIATVCILIVLSVISVVLYNRRTHSLSRRVYYGR